MTHKNNNDILFPCTCECSNVLSNVNKELQSICSLLPFKDKYTVALYKEEDDNLQIVSCVPEKEIRDQLKSTDPLDCELVLQIKKLKSLLGNVNYFIIEGRACTLTGLNLRVVW